MTPDEAARLLREAKGKAEHGAMSLKTAAETVTQVRSAGFELEPLEWSATQLKDAETNARLAARSIDEVL